MTVWSTAAAVRRRHRRQRGRVRKGLQGSGPQRIFKQAHQSNRAAFKDALQERSYR